MRNASVHLSIVRTLSLMILGLDSSWPLSLICRIPPKHKSWSSTFPFNMRAIFIYWWAQIFWHSCRGTCEEMSSPPKRRVSSPLVKLNDSWVLLEIVRTLGEMTESLIICSMSTKFARGLLWVLRFAGRVRCFALPSSCEFVVCESGSPWSPLPNCKTSTASSVPFDDLSLFPPLSTAPLPRPLRVRVFRPSGIIKIHHRCLPRISNYADCFLENFCWSFKNPIRNGKGSCADDQKWSLAKGQGAENE